jgi:hypothetical protein
MTHKIFLKKRRACIKKVALWLQTAIEHESKDHALAPSFEKHLSSIFKGVKFSFSKSTPDEKSSKEFLLFVKRTNLPLHWFPVFEIHVDTRIKNMVHVVPMDTSQPIPIYTERDFFEEQSQN